MTNETTPAETPATETAEAKEETPATATETKVEGETETKPEEAAEAPAAKEETKAAEEPPAKATKPKPPPKDYGPIISEVQDMDVLSGRGAAVNNHPGNKKFRALCFVRKAHFDLGNHAAKRKLATEIVEILQCGKDHPPSRFLKRRPANALPPAPPAEAAAPATTSTEGGETTAPAPAADGTTPAAPAPSPSAPLYYAMTKEQAILKAQQVMRDYKRPDRLEAKMLQQQAQQARYGGGEGTEDQAALANIPKPHRARAVPSTPLEGVVDMLDAPDIEKDALFQTNPFGVHAHDVLSGRGAYVNGHVGNARLRKLALERKPQFDGGNYTEKRQLASEIVTIIKSLDPPGRFLKKASKELLEAHEKAAAETKEEAPKEGEAAKKEETKTTEEATKEGEAAKADEAKPEAASEPTAPALPPLVDGVWEELSDDKAIHKACQVMRDISRPDRKYREERKEERLKNKRNNKRRKLNDGAPAAETETKKEETTDGASTEVKEESSTAVAVEDVVDKALNAPAPAASVEV